MKVKPASVRLRPSNRRTSGRWTSLTGSCCTTRPWTRPATPHDQPRLKQACAQISEGLLRTSPALPPEKRQPNGSGVRPYESLSCAAPVSGAAPKK